MHIYILSYVCCSANICMLLCIYYYMYAVHRWIGIHAHFASSRASLSTSSTRPAFDRCSFSTLLACSALTALAPPPGGGGRCKPSKECSRAPLGFLEAGGSGRPCLGGARRKPGKGTPVRVGNLPMKSECVHTKALTPGGEPQFSEPPQYLG